MMLLLVLICQKLKQIKTSLYAVFKLTANDNVYATFATYQVAKSLKREVQSSMNYQARKSKCCMTKC